jgi:hypothetical protein
MRSTCLQQYSTSSEQTNTDHYTDYSTISQEQNREGGAEEGETHLVVKQGMEELAVNQRMEGLAVDELLQGMEVARRLAVDLGMEELKQQRWK